jgi:hypothetical protein
MEVGVGGVDKPSANGDSGTSIVRGRTVCAGGGAVGLVSAETFTKDPNGLDCSVLGDVGGLDCCETVSHKGLLRCQRPTLDVRSSTMLVGMDALRGERLKPGPRGDVGDVLGAFSLMDFSGGSAILSPRRGSWPSAKVTAESTSWIVDAVVVGRKREATRTRLWNELVVLAIPVNFGGRGRGLRARRPPHARTHVTTKIEGSPLRLATPALGQNAGNNLRAGRDNRKPCWDAFLERTRLLRHSRGRGRRAGADRPRKVVLHQRGPRNSAYDVLGVALVSP